MILVVVVVMMGDDDDDDDDNDDDDGDGDAADDDHLHIASSNHQRYILVSTLVYIESGLPFLEDSSISSNFETICMPFIHASIDVFLDRHLCCLLLAMLRTCPNT